MFTQLFGHYLLNKKLVSSEQLQKALEEKTKTKAKLGTLAIDAGYMTAEQVETVHEAQRRMDKRIGDIAVEMGFLTNEQVDQLLSKQKNSNLVLGQTLIDLGFMTNQQFEDALKEYKASASYDDESSENNESLAKDISDIFNLEGLKDKDFYIDYILLLIRNIIRFIGDDFAFAGCSTNTDIKCQCLCSQEITGAESAYTAIGCSRRPFCEIASRYANEKITEADEYAEACVGEFLNLQNGLFSVNISNTKNIELGLTPQSSCYDAEVNCDSNGIVITLAFSFGAVDFIISRKS